MKSSQKISQWISTLKNNLPKDVINPKAVISFEKSLDSFGKTQTLLHDDYNAEMTTSTNNTA